MSLCIKKTNKNKNPAILSRKYHRRRFYLPLQRCICKYRSYPSQALSDCNNALLNKRLFPPQTACRFLQGPLKAILSILPTVLSSPLLFAVLLWRGVPLAILLTHQTAGIALPYPLYSLCPPINLFLSIAVAPSSKSIARNILFFPKRSFSASTVFSSFFSFSTAAKFVKRL